MGHGRSQKNSWSRRLSVQAPVDLAAIDTGGTPGVLDKDAAAEIFDASSRTLSKLQEQLFADSLYGGRNSVLIVLQGMDTSGKGGVVKRVAGAVDPQGIRYHAFKKPTEEELAHHYLWRVERELPKPGQIGIFDRSHYEDLLVPRVHETITSEQLTERYAEIDAFEKGLVDGGTTVIKAFLHLGEAEQKNRLLRRLERSDKHWKFNPGDVDDRTLWPLFQDAYEVVLSTTSTAHAPWHVVPADHKWYSALAVQQLLVEALQGLELSWPEPDYDVDEQRRRLLAT
ncbi:PPK2 family polyphosphate kinase [Herbiconiux daphne]|uniref:Polyphosphate kinase 2 family protein n=1 Tax=Herbiconiux daphne TaxID=2970914 RepID=A0ABT2GWB7_9MICO|nr:PPK2 family polyphosphate kinase [Herbiconiux daphne]MCS5732245.1 polyphosphate kinase 2 family protein [Herbiconiux daphne]